MQSDVVLDVKINLLNLESTSNPPLQQSKPNKSIQVYMCESTMKVHARQSMRKIATTQQGKPNETVALWISHTAIPVRASRPSA